MLVRNSLLRIIIELNTILGSLVTQKGGDFAKVLGMVEEPIEEYAFFHVRPKVDVASFAILGEGVLDALAEEAVRVGGVQLAFQPTPLPRQRAPSLLNPLLHGLLRGDFRDNLLLFVIAPDHIAGRYTPPWTTIRIIAANARCRV